MDAPPTSDLVLAVSPAAARHYSLKDGDTIDALLTGGPTKVRIEVAKPYHLD